MAVTLNPAVKPVAAVRCERCRDTGIVSDGWNKDVASTGVPCPCTRRAEADARDWAACKLELAVGIPVALVAGGLLYWFS